MKKMVLPVLLAALPVVYGTSAVAQDKNESPRSSYSKMSGKEKGPTSFKMSGKEKGPNESAPLDESKLPRMESLKRAGLNAIIPLPSIHNRNDAKSADTLQTAGKPSKAVASDSLRAN